MSSVRRQTPDISGLEDDSSEEEHGYDPWSEQFVKMQMGQLMIRDNPVDQSFSERKHNFLINGTNYTKERLLGEGQGCYFFDQLNTLLKNTLATPMKRRFRKSVSMYGAW